MSFWNNSFKRVLTSSPQRLLDTHSFSLTHFMTSYFTEKSEGDNYRGTFYIPRSFRRGNAVSSHSSPHSLLFSNHFIAYLTPCLLTTEFFLLLLLPETLFPCFFKRVSVFHNWCKLFHFARGPNNNPVQIDVTDFLFFLIDRR